MTRSDFEFVTQGGDEEEGDDIVGCDDNAVQVSFDSPDDNVANAASGLGDGR